MLVVLSDLHLAAGGGGIGPPAFAHLWRHLDLLAEQARPDAPITVVLNGDVIEILQSERWLTDGTRPYNFAGRPEHGALVTAGAIGHAVLDDNAAGLAALGGRGARFVCVYGNHDRLLREPALAPVRDRLARSLGDLQFVDELLDERHHLVIQHGHELDWTCSEYQHARVFDDVPSLDPARRALAPLGDWVALDIGTRLPHLAGQMLSSDDRRWPELNPSARRELHGRLARLGSLRPQSEVLRWLVRPTGLGAHPQTEAAAIARFLGDLLNELVTQAMPLADPWLEAHDQPLFDRLALGAVGLLGSIKYTASSVPALMEKIQAYLAEQDKPWTLLPRLREWTDPRYRYFVGGHTHDAAIFPLGARTDAEEDARWYVNTGTWGSTILRSPLAESGTSYGAVNQLAFAVFFDAEETERATGRRKPSVDFWQSSTERF